MVASEIVCFECRYMGAQWWKVKYKCSFVTTKAGLRYFLAFITAQTMPKSQTSQNKLGPLLSPAAAPHPSSRRPTQLARCPPRSKSRPSPNGTRPSARRPPRAKPSSPISPRRGAGPARPSVPCSTASRRSMTGGCLCGWTWMSRRLLLLSSASDLLL